MQELKDRIFTCDKDWTLTARRFFLNQANSGDSKQPMYLCPYFFTSTPAYQNETNRFYIEITPAPGSGPYLFGKGLMAGYAKNYKVDTATNSVRLNASMFENMKKPKWITVNIGQYGIDLNSDHVEIIDDGKIAIDGKTVEGFYILEPDSPNTPTGGQYFFGKPMELVGYDISSSVTNVKQTDISKFSKYT